tara:strand:- start:728 stop:922 length:195 start_codon:yes stop_codon:yes gene_type:complete
MSEIIYDHTTSQGDPWGQVDVVPYLAIVLDDGSTVDNRILTNIGMAMDEASSHYIGTLGDTGRG